MKKVVTFGELLLRLSPAGFDRIVQADSFDAVYGGSEANVAVSLANFGAPASFVSALPDNEIGRAALNSLRKFGVETDKTVFSDGRLGLYYLEKGAAQRPSKVIYDRAESVFAKSSPADYDWDEILDGAAYFHYSGITPALSSGVRETLCEAIRVAGNKGITVCCDLNYRSKLWDEATAGKVMAEFLDGTDILVANIEPASRLFGFEAESTEIKEGFFDGNGCETAAKELSERFEIPTVAITLRGTLSANRNNFAAMLLDGGNIYYSDIYTIDIVDRVGAGDAFTAGLIYSLINGYCGNHAVDFAVAAGVLKHSVNGDTNLVSTDEVNAVLNGSDGRVQR